MPMSYSTSDKTIRKALLEELHTTSDSSESTIKNEYTVTSTGTRADVVVIRDSLHGYELKSDRDSLTRLSRQIEGYNAVFDKITLVVGKKYLEEVLYLIPDWWGLIVAREVGNNLPKLLHIRKALPNPVQNVEKIANLLHKKELIFVLSKYYRSGFLHKLNKARLINIAATELPEEELKVQVRSLLAVRCNVSC